MGIHYFKLRISPLHWFIIIVFCTIYFICISKKIFLCRLIKGQLTWFLIVIESSLWQLSSECQWFNCLLCLFAIFLLNLRVIWLFILRSEFLICKIIKFWIIYFYNWLILNGFISLYCLRLLFLSFKPFRRRIWFFQIIGRYGFWCLLLWRGNVIIYNNRLLILLWLKLL